jgi:AcrR family transcriptional regulator
VPSSAARGTGRAPTRKPAAAPPAGDEPTSAAGRKLVQRKVVERKAAGPDAGTREKIMEAASVLFSEKGLHGPTAREIARAAGVHPNLVGYHFDTVEALYNAVIDQVTDQIMVERTRMLSDLDVRYSPGSPPVAEILLTIVRPWMAYLAKDPAGFRRHVRLAGREAGTRVWAEFIDRKLAGGIRQQIAMLHRALPTASREDVVMLVQLTYAAITMVADYTPDERLDHELAGKGTSAEIESRIVKVMTAAALGLA